MRVPESFNEARESPESASWQVVEAKEIGTMLENEVWGKPMPLPPRKTVVGSKWVYDIKYLHRGSRQAHG
jgi:hypothetical protein